VHFSLRSHTPCPFQLCYCSICRKTAGGGGFAINLMGDARSLAVEGERSIGVFQAEIREEDGHCEVSSGQRRFCKSCGSALWLFDPAWPDLVHPFASAIDSDLPKPPERVHLMLKYKANWVEPVIGKKDKVFDVYPEESIADWHKRTAMWVD